jgi:hypothetical protein
MAIAGGSAMSARTFEWLRDVWLGRALWSEVRGLRAASMSDAANANFFHRCAMRDRGVVSCRELQR